MSSTFQHSIVCKLGGYAGSNPEIVVAYPPLKTTIKNIKDLISVCMPLGCKNGDFIIDKYENHNLLSYIFNVKKDSGRDDLFSFSILLDKKLNPELYKPIIKSIIDDLQKNNLLSEEILLEFQNIIYRNLNDETNFTIREVSIQISEYFKEINKKNKEKPKLKGSFY